MKLATCHSSLIKKLGNFFLFIKFFCFTFAPEKKEVKNKE